MRASLFRSCLLMLRRIARCCVDAKKASFGCVWVGDGTEDQYV